MRGTEGVGCIIDGCGENPVSLTAGSELDVPKSCGVQADRVC